MSEPPRLAARVQVSALIRLVEGEGGSGTVVARGDYEAGAILLWLSEKGVFRTLWERVLGRDGSYGWESVGPDNSKDLQSVNTYIARRRTIDADLWIVELDIADVERFAARVLTVG